MKELSIEEKAKRYDEAKLRMSAAYNSNRCTIGFMNEIFPELKESEDERIRKDIVTYLKSVIDNKGYRDKIIESWIAWLEKQGEKGTKGNDREIPFDAWSEEDEKQARQIERIVHDDGCTQKLQKQIADWLKSLKDRIQPQPKQEWSEEDENMFLQINNEIEAIKSNSSTIFEKKIAQDKINWLKSLKNRYTWKPSEEQMKALKGVQEGVFRLGILESLYQDLKKLMEK